MKDYIREIKKNFINYGIKEKHLLRELKRQINLELGDKAKYEDIVEHYGDSNSFINSYYQNEQIDETMINKNKLKKRLFILVGVVVIICGIFFIQKVIEMEENYIDRDIIIIEEVNE